MTYGINIRPYDDPMIAITEEAVEGVAELVIGGPFLVDILPILKYVPDWFPGAKFQKKAVILRTQAEKIRNAPFAATKKLMVFTPWPGSFSNPLMTPVQEDGDYDPSLVSEALRQTEHTDHPNQDIELLKDVAAQAYIGESASFKCLVSFLLGSRSVT